MKTKQFKVGTFEERAYCEDCGEELEFTCTVYPTYPARFVHICPKCNKEDSFYDKYPRIVYERIEEGKGNGSSD